MKLINIGSHTSNEYNVSDDTTISRKHAQLFWDGEKIVILTDLDSTNGTFVNGKKIQSPIQLNQLDVVKVGNTLIPWMELLFSGSSSEGEEIPLSKKKSLSMLAKFFIFIGCLIIGFLILNYQIFF